MDNTATREKTKFQMAVDTIRTVLHAFVTTQERLEILAAVAMPAEPHDARAKIDSALKSTGDNVTKAARVLGYSRRTLTTRMRELGMAPRTAGRKHKLEI